MKHRGNRETNKTCSRRSSWSRCHPSAKHRCLHDVRKLFHFADGTENELCSCMLQKDHCRRSVVIVLKPDVGVTTVHWFLVKSSKSRFSSQFPACRHEHIVSVGPAALDHVTRRGLSRGPSSSGPHQLSRIEALHKCCLILSKNEKSQTRAGE